MALGTAIRLLKKGDWQKAHSIVQQDESKSGCWAHGIVHIVEGDFGNARYGTDARAGHFPRIETSIARSRSSPPRLRRKLK
jgi:hypothetical protein